GENASHKFLRRCLERWWRICCCRSSPRGERTKTATVAHCAVPKQRTFFPCKLDGCGLEADRWRPGAAPDAENTHPGPSREQLTCPAETPIPRDRRAPRHATRSARSAFACRIGGERRGYPETVLGSPVMIMSVGRSHPQRT